MKTTLVCTIVAASSCALLISSAEAGGRRAGGGFSGAAQSTGASLGATGRSPLGEPVFLIPSTTSTSTPTNGGPIGGFVVNPNPLPLPQKAPNPNYASVFTGGGQAGQQVSVASGSRNSGSSSANNTGTGSTHIIFTPPPTIVGVPPSVTGTGNLAGTNFAADRVGGEGKFSGSILDTGLRNQISAAQPPSAVSVDGPHATSGAAVSVVPRGATGPTVQLGTTSPSASTSSSAANGH